MEIGRWDTPPNGFSDLGNGAVAVNGSSGCGCDSTVPLSVLPSSPDASSSSSAGVAEGCILHRVSMKDTLAGVAIKYGVEVADIKLLNGFSTDLQMFAHKTIRIPYTGRHPPPSHLPDGPDENRVRTPPRRPNSDILGTLTSLKPPRHTVTPAMSLLHGYYGLGPLDKSENILEGTEMAIQQKGKSICPENEEHLMDHPNSEPIPNQHRKTRSLVGALPIGNGELISDRMNSDSSDTEGSVRRRQKADASPELLPRKESSSAFSASAGRGLALRPKSSRADLNKSQQNLRLVGGDFSFSEGLLSFKKSSSTSNLQESDTGMSSFMSSFINPEALAPLFEGIPNPIASWRNKAAKD